MSNLEKIRIRNNILPDVKCTIKKCFNYTRGEGSNSHCGTVEVEVIVYQQSILFQFVS